MPDDESRASPARLGRRVEVQRAARWLAELLPALRTTTAVRDSVTMVKRQKSRYIRGLVMVSRNGGKFFTFCEQNPWVVFMTLRLTRIYIRFAVQFDSLPWVSLASRIIKFAEL
jgi:hypothetical protein